MLLKSLTLVLLAARAYSAEEPYPAELHPAVQARLQEFSKGLQLRIASDKQPYQDTDSVAEVRCGAKIFSCYNVYFYNRNRLLEADNITFSARSYLDADLDTPYGKEDDRFPAKVSATKSTAVTDATTKGWKVSLKLSAGGAPGKGGEIGGEYGEQYTTSTTTTTQITHEAPCPAGNRCTIQTLTYHAMVKGKCRVEPIINCGGDQDACLGFRKTWTKPQVVGRLGTMVGERKQVYEWEEGPCNQWIDYSRRHCSQGHYKTEPCEVYAPILDASGKPRTSVVVTREKLAWGTENPASGNTAREVDQAALPELEFLTD
ncbi:hypothetical protein HIM_09130 [Hirsutella minnesotensis 3608]|uniref:Uncharacterized protein n=1 Tax=Hirsutella minnesotensis 3608 TaxID=1043627 RepID=A0A0F7ZGU3_9HYPO|nr:hypothetical protein HIM_09130 [Hirsutella minnesotensis 3608]